jgi:putative sporulation protein YtxC
MDSLTLVMRNSAEHCSDDLLVSLDRKFANVHKNELDVQLNCERHDKFSIIQIKFSEKILEVFGTVVAEYIVNVLEPSVLSNLIKREFQIEAAEDIRSIEGYCRQYLSGDKALSPSLSASLNRRQDFISERILEYFQEHSLMVVEGFLRFRLQEYVEQLRELVEYAVEESMMDRQYEEFISLLQYFVYMQEAKIPTVHLIHHGGHEFLIFNAQLEAIDTKEFDAGFKLEVLDKDVNFEDMIVSTLISVAPANIHIHTREPDLLIVKTIMQIFEGRTILCSYCRMCHTFLGNVKKKDHLYP